MVNYKFQQTAEELQAAFNKVLSDSVFVSTMEEQPLTSSERAHARENIEAAGLELIPTKLSELENDLDLINKEVVNLLNYYLKDEVYTKEEVLELVNNIKTAHFERVDDLPFEGESNIIYLVNRGQNLQDEYIWVDDAWDKIGSTEIDLSDYVNLDLLNEKLMEYISQDQIMNFIQTDTASITKDINNNLKIPNNIDLCFQSISYGNGESGYRKYRNGLLEQWGVATTQAGETEFGLHQAYRDTNFSIFIEPREVGNFFHYAVPSAPQKFKTRIASAAGYHMAVRFQWRSFGYWK